MSGPTIRRQPNVISPGGDRWKAWEIDILGTTFYVQETDGGLDHVLQLNERGDGYSYIQPGRAKEVVTILQVLDKTAAKIRSK